MNNVFFLLVIYQIKHFLCDFPFQTPYMLGKFKGGRDWIAPLSAHCGIHALFTFLIVVGYFTSLGTNTSLYAYFIVALPALDFIIHFIMDRIKASPNMLGRFKPLSKEEMISIQSFQPMRVPGITKKEQIKQKFGKQLSSNIYFWWALGLDQAVHHLTHYLIIYLLVTKL